MVLHKSTHMLILLLIIPNMQLLCFGKGHYRFVLIIIWFGCLLFHNLPFCHISSGRLPFGQVQFGHISVGGVSFVWSSFFKSYYDWLSSFWLSFCWLVSFYSSSICWSRFLLFIFHLLILLLFVFLWVVFILRFHNIHLPDCKLPVHPPSYVI